MNGSKRKALASSVAREKGDQGDFREITLITLLCCFDEEGQFLVFEEGQFLVFEEGQLVLFEQQNFERLKNREDGSDFDDFLTKSIATTRTKFRKKIPRRARRRRRRRRCRRRRRRRGRRRRRSVKSLFTRATLLYSPNQRCLSDP